MNKHPFRSYERPIHLPPPGEYINLHSNCFQLIQAEAPREGT